MESAAALDVLVAKRLLKDEEDNRRKRNVD